VNQKFFEIKYIHERKHSRVNNMKLTIIAKIRETRTRFLQPTCSECIDCTSSIQPIDEIFSRTLQNESKKNMEPTRPVHAPWVELIKEHDIKWEPSWQDK